MAKIISIQGTNSSGDWKNIINGSNDSFVTVFQNTKIEIILERTSKALVFDFQKGFHPKAMILNNLEIFLDKNLSRFETPVDLTETELVEVEFKESYDPYGRIFIYGISAF